MKCAVLNVRATTGTTTRKWKSATQTLIGPPLANTMMNRRKKKMTIKCPYCGSEEYEVYDTCGGSGENIEELCACLDCDKQFSIIYVVDCVEKES